MSQFLTTFVGEQLEDGIHWKLMGILHFQDDVLGDIFVPAGFVTDGGSVPPIAQGFINPYGRGLKAFALHDWLYGTQKYTRQQSDEVLRRALASCGENWLDDDVQFDAVRVGGQGAWDSDKANIQMNLGLLNQGQGV